MLFSENTIIGTGVKINILIHRSLLVDDGASDDGGNNSVTDVSNELGGNHSRDAYEFIAFIFWYAAMIACCVVPTCCAYRRRGRVDRHLYTQQQRALDNFNWQQHQEETMMFVWSLYGVGGGEGANGGNQTLMLQSLDSEAAVRERTKRLEVAMEEETFSVKDGDIVCNANANTNANANIHDSDDKKDAKNDQEGSETECNGVVEKDIERGSVGVNVGVGVGVDADENENNAELRLPTKRSVPDICAICLCPYEVGDRVTYSEATTTTTTISDEEQQPAMSQSQQSCCPHAFHTDCIVEWLAKKNDARPECPCCRRPFCTVVPITTADLGNNGYNRILPTVHAAPSTSNSTRTIITNAGDAGGSGSTQTTTIYRVSLQ